jgi:hypothetical protein
MKETYMALWSRREPQIVIITDGSRAIVDSVELVLPFRHPTRQMLSDTEWFQQPGGRWKEDLPGEWSIPVSSFRCRPKEAVGDVNKEREMVGVTAHRDVDCLDKLRKELRTKGVKCELVTTGACTPYLHIKAAGEYYRSADDLQCHVFVSTEPDGEWRFWWPWIEPIAGVEEMTRAADYIVELYRNSSADVERRDP